MRCTRVSEALLQSARQRMYTGGGSSRGSPRHPTLPEQAADTRVLVSGWSQGQRPHSPAPVGAHSNVHQGRMWSEQLHSTSEPWWASGEA